MAAPLAVARNDEEVPKVTYFCRLPLIALSLLVTACAPSAASEEGKLPSDSIACKGIGDCEEAVGELQQADAAMAKALQDAVERMRSCKGQNTTRCAYWERAIGLVQAEQDAWSAWRLAHCQVFALPVVDTSAEGMLEAICRADLARKRTEELDKIMRPEE